MNLMQGDYRLFSQCKLTTEIVANRFSIRRQLIRIFRLFKTEKSRKSDLLSEEENILIERKKNPVRRTRTIPDKIYPAEHTWT